MEPWTFRSIPTASNLAYSGRETSNPTKKKSVKLNRRFVNKHIIVDGLIDSIYFSFLNKVDQLRDETSKDIHLNGKF